jgi:hypothetical protein
MKSMGESGSPCHNPLACFMRLPGELFRRILEDEVARRVAIQSLMEFMSAWPNNEIKKFLINLKDPYI